MLQILVSNPDFFLAFWKFINGIKFNVKKIKTLFQHPCWTLVVSFFDRNMSSTPNVKPQTCTIVENTFSSLYYSNSEEHFRPVLEIKLLIFLPCKTDDEQLKEFETKIKQVLENYKISELEEGIPKHICKLISEFACIGEFFWRCINFILNFKNF